MNGTDMLVRVIAQLCICNPQFHTWITIFSIGLVLGQANAEISSDKILYLSIRPSKMIYQFKERIALDIELRNVKNEKIYILRKIFPEGWLLTIKATDKKGIRAYNSPIVKIEMTAATLETIQLERGYFYGARFIIEKNLRVFI